MTTKIFIAEYEVMALPGKDYKEAEINIIVKTINTTGIVSDSETLRVWIEGKNTLNEPIQIVLTEHLHIESESINILSATLFNPVLWSVENPYLYKGKVELLDKDENIIESYSFNLAVKKQ